MQTHHENLESAKRLVWNCVTELVPPRSAFSPCLRFWGPTPFGRLTGRDAFFECFILPVATCLDDAKKEPYLFMGDRFQGATWVAATGDVAAKMSKAWIGIPPIGGTCRLRFGEFYKIDGGVVTEMRCLLDIPGLAAQAGIEMLSASVGRSGVPPGPPRSDGIILDPQPQEVTATTRSLVERMIAGCNQLLGSDLASQGMERFWHEDMAWHGPWGIGSCRGIEEFHNFAQEPSVRSFPSRRGTWPKDAFIADGRVAAFTGWPSLVGDFTGSPFLGIPPTQGSIGQTIMDFYIRRGNMLAENWVMIDLIRFAADCGIDLMAKLQKGNKP